MKRLFPLSVVWVLVVLAGASVPLLGQPPGPDRVSEREVDRQTRFIDAQREMLIGNHDKAEAILTDLLEDRPDDPALAFALARNAFALEAYARAATYARLAIDEDPDNPWYRSFLGELYEAQGDDRRAAEVYEDLVRVYPEREEYYLKWAFFLVRLNELEDALRVYQRLEKRLGVSEEVIRRKHALYVGLGDTERAAAELQRLVDAYPRSPSYRHLLAAYYEDIGATEEARAVYEQILAIDPQDAEARLALAGAAGAGTETAPNLQALRIAFENPDLDLDPKIRQLIPVVQRVAETGDAGLADAALELTDLLDRQYPREAKVHATAGDLLYHSGRVEAATAEYEAALALDDTVFPVWEQLMNAYQVSGAYEDLRDRAEEAMDYFPNQTVAYLQYGRASLFLGEAEDARYAFEQALLMSSADPQLTFILQSQLGVTYHQLENYPRSEAAFEQALQLQPDQPDVLRAYAACLADRSVALDRAEQLAADALKQRPEQPAFLDTYGWVLYRQEDYRRAERYLREALDRGGDTDPGLLEHFGDLSFQLGRQEQAVEYWNRALEAGGLSPLLEKKINDKQLYE